MTLTTPATQELDAKGIYYRFFRHPGQLSSLEQAAAERGQRPEQVVRSILFRLSQDDFIMVLENGSNQISWKRLRKYLRHSRITMASDEEVLRVTGYLRGAVSPFGLPRSMRILVDVRVMQEEDLSIGSGERNTTILISRTELLRALGNLEFGSFVD